MTTVEDLLLTVTTLGNINLRVHSRKRSKTEYLNPSTQQRRTSIYHCKNGSWEACWQSDKSSGYAVSTVYLRSHMRKYGTSRCTKIMRRPFSFIRLNPFPRSWIWLLSLILFSCRYSFPEIQLYRKKKGDSIRLCTCAYIVIYAVTWRYNSWRILLLVRNTLLSQISKTARSRENSDDDDIVWLCRAIVIMRYKSLENRDRCEYIPETNNSNKYYVWNFLIGRWTNRIKFRNWAHSASRPQAFQQELHAGLYRTKYRIYRHFLEYR